MGLGSFLPTSARLALGRSVVLVGVGRAVTDEAGDENTPALIQVFGARAGPDDNSGHVFGHTPVYQRVWPGYRARTRCPDMLAGCRFRPPVTGSPVPRATRSGKGPETSGRRYPRRA